MRLNRDAYNRGFVAAIEYVKEAMESSAPAAGLEEAGQKGVPSKTMGPEQALKTVKPFGGKPGSARENLRDTVMKRDDLSHGSSSSVSGEGTDNY